MTYNARTLTGMAIGAVLGLGLCYLYWLAIGQPVEPDWTVVVGAALANGGVIAGYVVGAWLTDQAEVQRQIKSEGGRTWRRTVRVLATEWVADEEEK